MAVALTLDGVLVSLPPPSPASKSGSACWLDWVTLHPRARRKPTLRKPTTGISGCCARAGSPDQACNELPPSHVSSLKDHAVGWEPITSAEQRSSLECCTHRQTIGWASGAQATYVRRTCTGRCGPTLYGMRRIDSWEIVARKSSSTPARGLARRASRVCGRRATAPDREGPAPLREHWQPRTNRYVEGEVIRLRNHHAQPIRLFGSREP